METYGEWLLRAELCELTSDEKRHALALRDWDRHFPQEALRLQALVHRRVRLVGRHRAYDARAVMPRDGAIGFVVCRLADRLLVDFASLGQLLCKEHWIIPVR